MKAAKLLASASITGVVIAGAVVSPALAWHPKGTIVKYVQNETTSSAMSDANDEGAAVGAKPGDILKYTVTVSNTGAPASNGDDDMANTVMIDTLPAGVELVSNPSQRILTVNIGTVKPGASVTKSYEVKITSTTDGDVITNKACFTGNSLVNDNPQSGCDVAVVKVTVPATPTPQPKPTTPTAPKSTTAAPTLPNTGAGNVALLSLMVSAVAYAGYLLRLKRRAAQH